MRTDRFLMIHAGLAFQTHADPQELHDKRTDVIAREARRDEQRAEEEPEAPVDGPVVLPSSPLSAEQVAAYARAAGFPEDVI